MGRLIDADALVHDLAEWYVKESPVMSGCVGDQAVADMIWEFIKVVNKRPTIDAVSVVRCKDCKFFCEHYFSMNCSYHVSAVCENWFCSQGRVTE